MIKRFLLAIQFLTIFPIKVKNVSDEQIGSSSMFFPAIGVLISLVLFFLYALILNLHFDPYLNSAIITITLIVITGGLHLDGVADTFDAIASNKDREASLAVMRDSSTGAIGVLALISIIILKILLLAEVSPSNMLAALLFMLVFSRFSQVLSLKMFKYIREEGKAKLLFTGTTYVVFIIAAISTLLFTTFFNWPNALYIFIIILSFTLIFNRLISVKFGALTGDTIGAVSEINEVIVLFLFIVIQRF